MEYNIENRKSINSNLNTFDHLAKKEEFIEITEWTNNEGWDIIIGENIHFSLTYGQLEAINYLIKTLDYDKH